MKNTTLTILTLLFGFTSFCQTFTLTSNIPCEGGNLDLHFELTGLAGCQPFTSVLTFTLEGPNLPAEPITIDTYKEINDVSSLNTGTYIVKQYCDGVYSRETSCVTTFTPAPTFTFSLSNLTPCEGSAITYATIPPSVLSDLTYYYVQLSSSTPPINLNQIQASQSGTYISKRYGTDGCVSTSSNTQTLNVITNPYLGTLSVDNLFPCPSDNISLNTTSVAGSTYAWSGPNGFTSTLQNPTIANIQVAGTGTYSLVVTNTATGCSSVASANSSIQVLVNGLPSSATAISFSDNTPCAGTTLSLNTTSVTGCTYAWSGPNGFTSTLQNPTISNIQTINNGVYSLTITNSVTGCVVSTANVNSSSIDLQIVELPIFTSSVSASDLTPCFGESVFFTTPFFPFSTFSWSGPNGFTSIERMPTLSDLQSVNTGVYSLVVTKTSTGCSSVASANSSLNLLVDCFVGLNENENSSKAITVFPNPFNQTFNLTLSELSDIEIVNSLGKLIYQNTINIGINTIDLSNISSGVYFLKCNDTVLKIIKE